MVQYCALSSVVSDRLPRCLHPPPHEPYHTSPLADISPEIRKSIALTSLSGVGATD